MASLDLGFDDAGDGIARQSLQSSTPNSPAQPHHIIDFSSSSAQQTPPESSNLHDTPMGGAAGHMIDFGDYKRPPTSHRTIRVAASVDTTADIDSSLLAELPSVQKMQRHVRPTTANAMKARRASRARAQAFQRTRKSQVRPMMQNDLDMDEPSRLQNRDNVRAQLSGLQLIWFDVKVWWHLQRTKRRDPIFIWRTSIKNIEGEFGSALTSFFVFLRWLFLLNAALAVIIGSLIVFPAVAFFDYSTQITASLRWYNVFDGQGAVGQTWIFYGGYPSHLQDVYRLDLVYILTMVVVYIGCFFFIFNNIASAMGSVSSSGSLVKMDNRYTFTTLTLLSWDYSFTNKNGINNLRKGIRQAFVETLAEARAKLALEALQDLDHIERAKLVGKRLVAWFIYGILVAGAFAGVWYVIQNNESKEETIFTTYGPVVVFSFINGALPYPIKKLPGLLEHYKHPRMEMQITIFRTFMLRTLTIYALLYGLFVKYDLNKPQLPVWQKGVVTPQENCAGTLIGQELWKLVVADTFVSIVQRFASTFFFYKLYGRRVQLEVVQSVLGLVYRQGLIWVGMVFCPALPLLAMLSNVVYFYFYLKLVRRYCRPPDKRFTQNRNNTFFMFCLALTLLFVGIPVAWALKVYNPNCGPYGAPRYQSPFDGIWEWIQDQNQDFRAIVGALIDPVTVCSVLLMFVVYVRVLKIQNRQQEAELAEVTQELQGLREDKRFLLAKSSHA